MDIVHPCHPVTPLTVYDITGCFTADSLVYCGKWLFERLHTGPRWLVKVVVERTTLVVSLQAVLSAVEYGFSERLHPGLLMASKSNGRANKAPSQTPSYLKRYMKKDYNKTDHKSWEEVVG